MANTNTRISSLVNTQVPFFVRNDHGTFVSFLEAYYEYLEQTVNTPVSSGKVVERIKSLPSYIDIDRTLDEFADILYKRFLESLPSDILADKDIILKHALEFYRSRGTEKSYKFLLRVISGQEAQFYYPKKDILRVSDGKWYIQKTLRVSNTAIEGVSNTEYSALALMVNRNIRGNTSNALARVESIDRYFEGATQVDEITISNIKGTFENGELLLSNVVTGGANANLTTRIFSGLVTGLTIVSPGYNYEVGDELIFSSNSGSGATGIVTNVTSGNLTSIVVVSGGAGFQVNNNMLITPTQGANARVSSVNTAGIVHPNSYNICISTISLEANTTLDNATYTNLNSSNANTMLQDAYTNFIYSNTGPILTVTLVAAGSGFSETPDIAAIANSRVQALGILGRLEIQNAGTGYRINDPIEFTNVPGGYGYGALAKVTNNVQATGAITEVQFTQMPGQIIGGSGYSQDYLPTATVNSTNTLASGASITANALLGSGDTYLIGTGTLGQILEVTLLTGGMDYASAPTVDLTGSGDGTAQVTATIVTGVFSYPGRWLNDDGHLSSYNFLQNRDYYQNFSYVVKVKESLANYKQAVKNLVHPAGMKLFGEYTYENDDLRIVPSINVGVGRTLTETVKSRSYVKTGNTVNVTSNAHGISAGANVTLEFLSGGYDNVQNGIYMVTTVPGANNFLVKVKSTIASLTINNAGRLYNANSYLVFTGDGNGANGTFTINANGSLVTVNVADYGINFTNTPTVTANGTNSVSATFNTTITLSNNTSGLVNVGVISV